MPQPVAWSILENIGAIKKSINLYATPPEVSTVSEVNKPDDIKAALGRLLKEKDLGCVIIDDIAGLKNIEEFELPKFVQDTASLIKSNEVQGLFLGKLENMDKNTINDISMLVDKVIGDEEKW